LASSCIVLPFKKLWIFYSRRRQCLAILNFYHEVHEDHEVINSEYFALIFVPPTPAMRARRGGRVRTLRGG
jgi:hypothetical protein